jgi:hypothetical protein
VFGGDITFFGVVNTPLVRYGGDEKLPKGQHTAVGVYSEMILQIARDYSGIPDVRTLKASEIRFFYEGLRAELKEHTRPKG